MAVTKPKPTRVIAWKRNGAPRRLDVPAQHLSKTVELLRTIDGPQAAELVEEFSRGLRIACFWSSPRRVPFTDRPAWGPCGRVVDHPSQRCAEHTWPLAEGAVDPTPDRCVATLDQELAERRWVNDSQGLRCPYERREGSDRCHHHDPRPEELCSLPQLDQDGAPCPVPEAIYPCRTHQGERGRALATALVDLVLATTCRQCAAPESDTCVTRSGRPVDPHKVRLVDAQGTDEGKDLSEKIEFYGASHRFAI